MSVLIVAAATQSVTKRHLSLATIHFPLDLDNDSAHAPVGSALYRSRLELIALWYIHAELTYNARLLLTQF